jgi:hypothetical protein
MDQGRQLELFEVEQEQWGLVISAAAFEILTRHGHATMGESSWDGRCDDHYGVCRRVEKMSARAWPRSAMESS